MAPRQLELKKSGGCMSVHAFLPQRNAMCAQMHIMQDGLRGLLVA